MTTPDAGEISDLPPTVLEVQEPVTSEGLRRQERLTRMHDDSWALHSIVRVWREKSDADRNLRSRYANVMLATLLGEVIFSGVMLILIGNATITLSPWVANVFFAAVFGQVAAGSLTITRYLFPATPSEQIPVDLLRLRHLPDEQPNKEHRR